MSGFIIMVGLLVYCAWPCVYCFDSLLCIILFLYVAFNELLYCTFFFFPWVLGLEDRKRGVCFYLGLECDTFALFIEVRSLVG